MLTCVSRGLLSYLFALPLLTLPILSLYSLYSALSLYVFFFTVSTYLMLTLARALPKSSRFFRAPVSSQSCPLSSIRLLLFHYLPAFSL